MEPGEKTRKMLVNRRDEKGEQIVSGNWKSSKETARERGKVLTCDI